ncbi:hypothetical protein AAC387_Pa05g1144 [Persea americana]
MVSSSSSLPRPRNPQQTSSRRLPPTYWTQEENTVPIDAYHLKCCQSPETATAVTGLIVTKDAHICAREALEATGKNTNTIPLAREILVDPVRVIVVEVGMVNEDITQIVNATLDDAKKMPWLLERLPGMIDEGDVLLFASRKAIVEENELQWIQRLFKVAALHGDKDQASQLDTS